MQVNGTATVAPAEINGEFLFAKILRANAIIESAPGGKPQQKFLIV